MIAAIYARKSTEQNGADADAKSVARQIENARTFATAKGWRVHTAHVYSDDAVSGAETRKLVNRKRLLDVALTDPPFQVLIMRDPALESSDGEEARRAEAHRPRRRDLPYQTPRAFRPARRG